MSQPAPNEIPPPMRVARMVLSLWVPQALHAAAELGVADALANGPRTSAFVAEATGAHPGGIHRLLRGLVVLELCAEADDGTFALTALGECLRADSPMSVRNWALLMGGEMCWNGWGRLTDSVRTGEPAPKLISGKGTFEYMEAYPRDAAIFNQSMLELTRRVAPALVAAYDFAGARTIVDVGGGLGAVLPSILQPHPQLRGVVFDLPSCREAALRFFAEAGLEDRMEFIAGSFFEGVPKGADTYLLKSVIHDWNDERSLAILKACRAAMAKDSRLLLVEVPMPERVAPNPTDIALVGSDLNMLVMVGGQERTTAEYRELLAAAGLRLERIVPTRSPYCILEGFPV